MPQITLDLTDELMEKLHARAKEDGVEPAMAAISFLNYCLVELPRFLKETCPEGIEAASLKRKQDVVESVKKVEEIRARAAELKAKWKAGDQANDG